MIRLRLGRRGVGIGVLGICLIGAVLGFLSNRIRVKGKLSWTPGEFPPIEQEAVAAGIPVVRWEEFRAARDAGGVVLDARSESQYNRGHVPGAISFPVGDGFDALMRHAVHLLDTEWIGVYGEESETTEALRVARMLRECDFEKVYLYVGGFEDWIGRGGESVVSGAPP